MKHGMWVLDRLGPLSNGREKGDEKKDKRAKRVPKKVEKAERGEGEKCKSWMDVE
jgi:hypothetical protein